MYRQVSFFLQEGYLNWERKMRILKNLCTKQTLPQSIHPHWFWGTSHGQLVPGMLNCSNCRKEPIKITLVQNSTVGWRTVPA
jgi:hypothetical protein